MTSFEKQKFLCLDIEATGLDKVQDRIIEVAAVIFDENQIYGEYQTLINPKCPISEPSFALHKITPEMVADKPIIDDVLDELLAFIGKHIIIGHSIDFDIDMIAKAAERAGKPCTIRNNLYIDTLRMARLYGDSPTNSLVQLRKHFNIEEETAHRAMNDVIINVEVFKQLAKSYKTVEKLFDVLSRPILLKDMPLGKHKGRAMKDIPLDYLRWAANKDFDKDLLFSIRSELKRRKTGNTFHHNPFQDL